MSTVTLYNLGLIDPRVIQFMGVNVKEGENAIGYFGTGLKFAIATLLRNKQSITIWRGLERFEFSSREELIRGKRFNLIYMNDTALGITTDLGRNWEMWMAMRELVSNCMDEKGVHEAGSITPCPDRTTIQVTGDAFFSAWQARDQVFITGRTPLVKNEFVEIYSGETSKMYYRGIVAGEIGKRMRYTYNVLAPLKLTEDRTIASQYSWWQTIACGTLICTNELVLKRMLAFQPETTLESSSDFDWSHPEPTKEFLDVCESLGRRSCNESAWNVWKRHRASADAPEYEIMELNQLQARKLEKAKDFLKSLGYEDEYTINVSADLGTNILGRAIGKVIWLSHSIFEQGTKQVASTLYEEWVHIKHGFRDNTYEMQTFLFNMILTKQEEINGEPL